MDEDIHGEIKVEGARLRKTMEALVAEAWECYKNRPPAEAADARTKSPYADKLAAILRSGDELAVEAITHNIDFFFARLKPPPRPKKRKAG